MNKSSPKPMTKSDAQRIISVAKNNPESKTAKDDFDSRAIEAASKKQTKK